MEVEVSELMLEEGLRFKLKLELKSSLLAEWAFFFLSDSFSAIFSDLSLELEEESRPALEHERFDKFESSRVKNSSNFFMIKAFPDVVLKFMGGLVPGWGGLIEGKLFDELMRSSVRLGSEIVPDFFKLGSD